MSAATPTRGGDMKVRLHPLRLIVAWVLGALGLMAAALIVPHVAVDNFAGALAVMAVIAILNAIVPPVLAAVRLPFTIATSFLLVLIADALMLMAADALTDGAITVDSFWLGAAHRAARRRPFTTVLVDHRRHERRRRVHAPRDPAHRAPVGRADRDGGPGDHLPRDRRALEAGAPAGDARRQRARDGALARRGHAPPGRVGDRPLLADRRQPGGHPARLEREHPRLPLGREGERDADGLLEPGRLRRDRAAALDRRRPARERRREPRQPALGRRRPRAADREPDQRREEGEPRLPARSSPTASTSRALLVLVFWEVFLELDGRDPAGEARRPPARPPRRQVPVPPRRRLRRSSAT